MPAGRCEGGKPLRETYGGNTLDFFYDQSGYPYALKYNGILYYYITNLQGDVLHLTNASGTVVVSYTYDPYGKVLDTTGTMATTLGAVNPLRYRGYYYDAETGFYYLQSRYYDPSICRFVNADALVSAGQGVLGHNMFSYCGNNSIRNTDPTGHFFWDSKNEEDDDDEYRIVGAGVQFTLSGDYGHISGTFGVEIVVYWDTAECHDTGGPIIAVYVFGEGDITLDFDSLPSEITDLVELLRDSGDLLKEDGINAFQAILAGTKLSASVSGLIFGIMANNTFQNTKNYEGWFDNESISIGSLKAARAWSSSCKTYSFGYSYSFGKPAFYLSWPKITKGKSLYGLLIQFNLGDS